MQNSLRKVSRNKFILIIIGIFFPAAIIVLTLIYITKDSNNEKNIKIFSLCDKAVTLDQANSIEGNITKYIKLANQVNNVTNPSSYNMSVRGGSCNFSENNGVRGISFILDIKNVKQSWVVKYSAMDENSSSYSKVSPGLLSVSCPTSAQLKYGDFHCQDAMNLLTVEEYCGSSYDNRTKKTSVGYIGFSGMSLSWQWSVASQPLSDIISRLNAYFAKNNASITKNDQVACVQAVANSGSFSVDKSNYYNVYSFKSQFITWYGKSSTHSLNYIIIPNTDGIINQRLLIDGS